MIKETLSPNQYHYLAIFLHWLMAILVVLLLLSGFSLYFDIWQSKVLIFKLYQLHKSMGVTLFALLVLRLICRIVYKPPKLPSELISQEKLISYGHLCLYLSLFLIPLSGWVIVSTDVAGIPTIVFGIFKWPHLSLDEWFYIPAKWVHFYGVWILLMLVMGHVLMTAKHQFSGITILQRMKPTKGVNIALLLTMFVLFIFSTSGSVLSQHQAIETKIISVNTAVDSQAAKIELKFSLMECMRESDFLESFFHVNLKQTSTLQNKR